MLLGFGSGDSKRAAAPVIGVNFFLCPEARAAGAARRVQFNGCSHGHMKYLLSKAKARIKRAAGKKGSHRPKCVPLSTADSCAALFIVTPSEKGGCQSWSVLQTSYSCCMRVVYFIDNPSWSAFLRSLVRTVPMPPLITSIDVSVLTDRLLGGCVLWLLEPAWRWLSLVEIAPCKLVMLGLGKPELTTQLLKRIVAQLCAQYSKPHKERADKLS